MSFFVDSLGTLGWACFAISGLTTAFYCIKDGHCHHLRPSLCWLVFSGACLMLAYLWIKFGFDLIVTWDYLLTISVWATVLKYKYFPREKRG